MGLIDRYIIRKFLSTFFFILLGIILISIVIDIAEKIDNLIEHKPPIKPLITDYYFNFALFFGNLLNPICVFLSVIFFTSRMTQNTEIVAILSSGVSYYRVLRPYIIVSVLLTVGSFYLNAYIVPVANQERVEFEYNFLRKNFKGHKQNIHRKIATDKEKETETFVSFHSFSRFYLEGYIFSLEEFEKGDIIKRLDCKKIKYNDSLGIWKLSNCEQRLFTGLKESFMIVPQMDTTFLLSPDDIFVKDFEAESIPLNKLDAAIELEKERGSELVDELILEKYERYAYPFATLILTIIGFSVSTQKRRGGTPIQLGIGLVISFTYVFLVIAGQALVGDDFPAWLGVWYPNILFSILAIFLLWRAPK